jgi:DNA-nicking Smr family endonuclease
MNDESAPDEIDSPVEIPIETSIDLHSFLPRDVPAVVEEYLDQCHQRGYREVRIIHGRGRGTQRAVVQKFLASHPLVKSFQDAPPEMGGWGATRVRLR